MISTRLLTAAEFVRQRADLPDGGRWTELVAGRPLLYDPPSEQHGNVVINLSKAVARVLRPTSRSFAVFDVGVPTGRNPDSLRFPAMSVFDSGDRFEMIDEGYATHSPALVLDIVGTPDRRREAAVRVREFHSLGVGTVWLVDPKAESVAILQPATEPQTLLSSDALCAPDLLPDFEMRVADLFPDPVWWRGNKS